MRLMDLMEDSQTIPDKRYDAREDDAVKRPDDTRKVRLTLEQISKLRRMQEVRKLEQKKQQDFFKVIYGAPPAAPGG